MNSRMVASDYGSTDLKDLEAKPHKKEKRPPTNALGGAPSPAQTGIPWDRILPILPIVDARARVRGIWKVSQQVPRRVSLGVYIVGVGG